MDRKDWLLLALFSAPPVHETGTAQRLTSIQLQKALFVLSQKRAEELGNFYEFVPYHYGPYSSAIASDLSEYVRTGLVSPVGDRERSYEWELTTDGLRAAEIRRELAPATTFEYLAKLTRWMQSVPLSTLLARIYERFPAFKREGNTLPRA